jgi:nitroimidazol reductase NimA-like FMN-containing flavoprotein (pyridoxamine 5'-phosphate oxidase superfamily)
MSIASERNVVRKRMEELDFEKLVEEKINFLREHHTIVLATSKDDEVTARTVSYATERLDFYILSWDHHEKIRQIKENPNVALARDNISIRGVAEILGKPLNEKSRTGAKAIQKKRPKEFEIFSRIPGMIMVKVTPSYIKSWVKVDNKLSIEHLDLENRRAYLQRPER